ncbi:MAG: YheC/YheD family protein [Alicyclobacillaceae bacterium]|nr:YheC/YheD family protein [Alicyclobacillaceae bacterium]
MVEGPLRVESLVHTQSVVYVAGPLLRRRGLRQGSTVTVRAGLGQSCLVQIRSHILDPNIFLAARPVLRKLGLRRGDRIHLMWGGTQLQLGPVVALWLPMRRSETGPDLGAQTGWARDAVRQAREMGILAYVLDSDLTGSKIRGWTWSKKKGWVRRPVPAPDALWRRGESWSSRRDMQHLPEGQKPLLLSPDIGDKWSIYKLLIEQGLGEHVPWTRPVRSPKQLVTAAQRFGHVYAKPRRGSQGRGLILLKMDDNRYTWFRYGEKPRRGVWTSVPTKPEWHRVAGNQAYIVQQALHPLLVDGKPVDFRWLVQRDRRGRWTETAVAARSACEPEGPTNLSQGGSVYSAEALLDTEDRETGRDLALAVAEIFGRAFPTLAELGIDLMFDEERRWWILDVNPRPGRLILRILDPALRQISIQKPFEYVKYATGYSGEEMDEDPGGSGV